jgi:tRNA nucleotidyltransferase/poly(A) polymerase
MNAMVLRPDGTIYDPYGGKLHIHKKHIVTVGLPKDRIQEDPLRMLRAARFAARYNFTIDPNFIGKARQLADRIFDVSVERWVQELDKLLTSDYNINGIIELQNMGVLVRILPEVEAILRIYPEFEGIEVLPSEELTHNADQMWKHLLGWSGLPYMEKPNDSRNRITRYINRGIAARLKFSNTRTTIIVG